MISKNINSIKKCNNKIIIITETSFNPLDSNELRSDLLIANSYIEYWDYTYIKFNILNRVIDSNNNLILECTEEIIK